MRKVDALEFFKTTGAIAECLGVTSSAVSFWGEVVPEGSAYKLQVLTRGRLRVDPALYENRPKRGQRLDAGPAA